MALDVLGDCKYSISVHAVANLCCCITRRTRSFMFRLNALIWSNAIRAARGTSPLSIGLVASAGKKQRRRLSEPCVTWPMSCCVFTLSANWSEATRMQEILHGKKNLRTDLNTH